MLSMGWVRNHRRFGAWPGLAALVLQIVLSFGHIHIGNVHLEGLWRNAAVATAEFFDGKSFGVNKSFDGKSQPAALAQSQQKSPAQNSGRNPGDNDDYCAICASIFLASTSLAAQPPLLPVPLHFERVALIFGTAHSLSSPRFVFFQSRAPPFA
jgi:hypothetical protein